MITLEVLRNFLKTGDSSKLLESARSLFDNDDMRERLRLDLPFFEQELSDSQHLGEGIIRADRGVGYNLGNIDLSSLLITEKEELERKLRELIATNQTLKYDRDASSEVNIKKREVVHILNLVVNGISRDLQAQRDEVPRVTQETQADLSVRNFMQGVSKGNVERRSSNEPDFSMHLHEPQNYDKDVMFHPYRKESHEGLALDALVAFDEDEDKYNPLQELKAKLMPIAEGLLDNLKVDTGISQITLQMILMRLSTALQKTHFEQRVYDKIDRCNEALRSFEAAPDTNAVKKALSDFQKAINTNTAKWSGSGPVTSGVGKKWATTIFDAQLSELPQQDQQALLPGGLEI
ncbi:hypothetical protein [Piscirickettsia salmonis]|uniref:hypothetical protein n=1 Tax=Piscirickettsia salmonis TaxID=1238 RepID=UPI00143E0A47|nr:hypothetical protein [Piscirickettsia salmonis]QIX57169.1 hypothetical protein GW536_17125 [Piscirickettsia salmonis]